MNILLQKHSSYNCVFPHFTVSAKHFFLPIFGGIRSKVRHNYSYSYAITCETKFFKLSAQQADSGFFS